MSFLKTAKPLNLKYGRRIISILQQPFSTNSVTFSPFKEGEDPQPRIRKRMDDIVDEETFHTKRSRKDMSALDNERIDKVRETARECMDTSHNVPQFKQCIRKADRKVHEIENTPLRHKVQDTLDKSRNVRPREW